MLRRLRRPPASVFPYNCARGVVESRRHAWVHSGRGEIVIRAAQLAHWDYGYAPGDLTGTINSARSSAGIDI